MARVITGALSAPTLQLSERQRQLATRRLARAAGKNALRRVHLACDTSGTRDPVAKVGDRVWCERHGDFAVVVAVVQ